MDAPEEDVVVDDAAPFDDDWIEEEAPTPDDVAPPDPDVARLELDALVETPALDEAPSEEEPAGEEADVPQPAAVATAAQRTTRRSRALEGVCDWKRRSVLIGTPPRTKSGLRSLRAPKVGASARCGGKVTARAARGSQKAAASRVAPGRDESDGGKRDCTWIPNTDGRRHETAE